MEPIEIALMDAAMVLHKNMAPPSPKRLRGNKVEIAGLGDRFSCGFEVGRRFYRIANDCPGPIVVEPYLRSIALGENMKPCVLQRVGCLLMERGLLLWTHSLKGLRSEPLILCFCSYCCGRNLRNSDQRDACRPCGTQIV